MISIYVCILFQFFVVNNSTLVSFVEIPGLVSSFSPQKKKKKTFTHVWCFFVLTHSVNVIIFWVLFDRREVCRAEV